MHIIITVLALGILAIGIFASQKVEDSSEEKVLGKENYDQLDVLPTSDLRTENRFRFGFCHDGISLATTTHSLARDSRRTTEH